MSESLLVRRAKLGDLESIVELRLSLLREYEHHPMYAHLRPDAPDRARELFRAQLLSPNEAIFVADVDGHTIGVLRCVDTPMSPLLLPERYCYVSSVFVRPGNRRQGVLRGLLGAAESWCAERGISEMRLHNSLPSDAGAVWSALGFEVMEEGRRRPLRAAADNGATAQPNSHAAVR